MELDPTLHRELAVFFHKRFPEAAKRQGLAAAARVHSPEPPEQRGDVAWGVLLTRAAEQQRLQRLVDSILSEPDVDAPTREVCALMLGRPWPPTPSAWSLPLVRVTAGLAGLAALGLFAMAFTGGERGALGPAAEPTELEPSAEELAMADADGPVRTAEALGGPTPEAALEAALLRSAVPTAAAATPAPTPVPAAPPAAAPASAASAPKTAATASSPAPPTAAAAPTAAAKVPPTAAATAGVPPGAGSPEGSGLARHHGRCTTAEGGIVGYWYAGAESPGKLGEIITMRSWANVRADMPGPHNRYNARAEERCALIEGDRVRLTAEPIQIAGGAYWVPLRSGDLVTGG